MKLRPFNEAPAMAKIRPVRKAVFPVAGMGTRFLPATKAVPKEMLPVASCSTALNIWRQDPSDVSGVV